MGRTIRIPLGEIAPDAISGAIDSALEAMAASIQNSLGDSVQIQVESLFEQNEVTEDGKTVALKALQKQLCVRKGVTTGANVTLTWNRRSPREVSIAIKPISILEEWLFKSTFVLAGIIAVAGTWSQVGRSRYVALAVFVAAVGILMIPYAIARVVISMRNQTLRNDVEALVRTVFNRQPRTSTAD